MTKGAVVYHSRILPSVGIFEIMELKVRTVTDSYFVGVDKQTKRAMLFPLSSINETVFENRSDALQSVKFAEKYLKKDISEETFYEED